MANFKDAFQITMKNEGGYANDPDDNGGETYAGIAHNSWPTWEGWATVHAEKAKKPASLNAVLAANTTLQSAVQAFYKTNFWNTLSLDTLRCQQTANQLFDAGVNSGISVAAKFLQQGINALKPNAVVVDKKVGPKTIAAANAANDEALYNQIETLRKQFYLAIIVAHPSQAKFERSWLSRLKPFKRELAN